MLRLVVTSIAQFSVRWWKHLSFSHLCLKSSSSTILKLLIIKLTTMLFRISNASLIHTSSKFLFISLEDKWIFYPPICFYLFRHINPHYEVYSIKWKLKIFLTTILWEKKFTPYSRYKNSWDGYFIDFSNRFSNVSLVFHYKIFDSSCFVPRNVPVSIVFHLSAFSLKAYPSSLTSLQFNRLIGLFSSF